MSAKYERVGSLLLANKEDFGWEWLCEQKPVRLNMRRANKFLLACILDDWQGANRAWGAARHFAEKMWRNPKDLWGRIRRFSESEWRGKKGKFKLHRFGPKHMRVWRIAGELMLRYGGDGRRLWRKRKPLDVLDSLVAMRFGPQVSRMVVGALFDTKHIRGRLDVKADRHVRRVLGRMFDGKGIEPGNVEQAVKIARKVYEPNPWKLDGPLFELGKNTCRPTKPKCAGCYLRPECKYGRRRVR